MHTKEQASLTNNHVVAMQEYGDIRTFYTALSQQWVLVGYYDLFAAKLAKNSLNGQILFGARVEASFSAWKEAREHNEGEEQFPPGLTGPVAGAVRAAVCNVVAC